LLPEAFLADGFDDYLLGKSIEEITNELCIRFGATKDK